MWCFWSAKGGVGCTVVAVTTALGLARAAPTLLVDLGDDALAMLGRPAIDVGLAQWLAADAPPPDALSRLEVEVAPGLSLLAWGAEPTDSAEVVGGSHPRPERAEILARLTDFEDRRVVVDLGVLAADDGRRAHVGRHLLALASRSTLVTRACRLSLRAAERWSPPDDVVLVSRQGRSVRSAEVEAAIGAPVVSELRWDPSIGRAVDAGRVAERPPRSLRRLAGIGLK